MTGDDEQEKIKFARAWTEWEMSVSKLFINQEYIAQAEDDLFNCQLARIETHYFVNGGFFKNENERFFRNYFVFWKYYFFFN